MTSIGLVRFGDATGIAPLLPRFCEYRYGSAAEVTQKVSASELTRYESFWP